MKKRSIRDIVKGVLVSNFASRDCDVILYERVCFELGFDLSKIKAMQLLKLTINKEVPSFDTVNRARRYIQENDSNLRGESWVHRQRHSLKVKIDINEVIQKKY